MVPSTDDSTADIAAAIIAVESAPANWHAQFELGSAYLSHELFSEAVAPLQRALQLDGSRVATHLNLSAALTNSGDGRAGEAAARAAIALDSSSDGYLCLGNAFRAQGRPKEAAAAFRRCLELDPLDVLARCNLGLALGDAGSHQDALAELLTVLQSRPDDLKALHGASVALQKLGDYQSAISMLRRICDVDPTDTEVWLALGFCLGQAERFAEGLGAFERLIAIDPDHVKGNYNLVATLINLGRASDAVEQADRALRLGPQHSEVATLLEIAKGQMSAQLGRLSDDGEWFWDGQRWRLVLSEDGLWRWDGKEWQSALTRLP